MIVCFLCKCSMFSLDSLLAHFSDAHKLKPTLHPVTCAYNGCPRSFSCQRWFIKHFLDVHSNCSCLENREAVINADSIDVPIVDGISMENREADINSHNTDASIFYENPPISASNGHQIQNDQVVVSSSASRILCLSNSYQGTLDEDVFAFCSSLYSSPGIPLSYAEKTMQLVMNLLTGINQIYEQKLIDLTTGRQDLMSENVLPGMKIIFNSVENTVRQYKTKYRCEKILIEKGLFIPPKQKHLGFIFQRRRYRKRYCVLRVKTSCSYIPLREVFRILLEQGGVLSSIFKYMEKLECEHQTIENCIQGTHWNNIDLNPTQIILPLFLFNDDIEVGNPLGGHAGVNKINATYCSLPCLPPEFRSSLCSIFVALLTKASNFKRHSMKTVFQPLIEELKFLSTAGISVKYSKEKVVQVYFQLCALLGDNLGLNTIGGFVQNFSRSNFCCRICYADKDKRKYLTREDASILRKVDTYNRDVSKNDASKSGIKERCALNDIKNVHILEISSVDPYHDLYEGIVSRDLNFLLRHYIYTKKCFTLSELNQKINLFNYGSCDMSNKPPIIPEKFNKKPTLKMSASESACFLKYFGLIIKSLVPESELGEVWELFIALRKVIEIVMSPSVDRRCCNLLTQLISEHHLLYIALTRKPLPFKYHVLIHYPRMILHFGPVVHLATHRYDSKHRIIKAVSNAVACKRNMCLTAARKCQMQLSHDFYLKKFSKRKLTTGINETDKNYFKFFEEIEDLVLTTPFPQILRHRATMRTSWVEINGTRYVEDVTLYLQVDEETSLPIFGLLKKIFVLPSGKVYFFLRNFETISFNRFLFAYELAINNSYCIFDYELLHDFHCQHAVPSLEDDKFYVSLLTNG